MARRIGVVAIGAAWAFAACWPAPLQAQNAAKPIAPGAGSLTLAQTVPDSRVILVYFAPDGSIVPAQVLNAAGDVAAVDNVEDSSVVWITIDDAGRAKLLETSATGDLVAARLDASGKPLVPEEVAPGTNIFAAQLGADGRLQVLLQPIDEAIPKIVVHPDNTISKVDAGIAPGKGLRLGGFLAVDNSGSGATGPYRGYGRVAVENLWDKNHSAALLAASSLQDPDAFAFVDVSYAVPFEGLVEQSPDRLAVSASQSRINYETLPPGQPAVSKFAIRSYSFATKYLQNLSDSKSPSGRAQSHSLTYGLLYDKLWTKDHGFGQDDKTSIVRIPLSVRYDFRFYDEALGLFTFAPTYVRNLPVGAAGEGADYRTDRVGADPRYDKLVLEAGHIFDLASGWSTLSRAVGQITDEPLVQSEQISLGGQSSVRGLETAKTLGEYGAIGQFEVLAPDLLTKPFSARPAMFVDAGWVKKDGDQPDTMSSETAVGTGVGLRLAGPYGLFANVYGGWLVGGTAVDRYIDDDGRFQLYLNAGVNF